MPRKKVDARVRILIENAIKSKTRSFFVVVGDRGKDQVANLHYILSKAAVKARPQVLWCYNKDLGFSTHRQKRMKQIKKLQARGLYESDKDDPFDLFISSTNIRWCYYKETHKVLGNTYGMCVLQDFEALTPNLLCRTIETVEGGGIVVLLLHTMTSLRQLYTLAMDVHARFRTEAHQDVVGRFNERFILSLASCEGCLVLDDELNVLPVSRHAKGIVPLVTGAAAAAGGAGDDDGDAIDVPLSESERALRDLKSRCDGRRRGWGSALRTRAPRAPLQPRDVRDGRLPRRLHADHGPGQGGPHLRRGHRGEDPALDRRADGGARPRQIGGARPRHRSGGRLRLL